MTEQATKTARRAYRSAIGVAVAASFLTVWTTIVRDEGSAGGFFMLILAVMVGWFSASFQAAGMARTMLGVAAMQLLLGVLVATAPVTAAMPDGSLRALLFSGAFAALWLLSGALFRIAARRDHEVSAER